MNGFGFYNAGIEAGPSQPHRHMQVVSLEDNHLPFFDIISKEVQQGSGGPEAILQIPHFEFSHAVCRIPSLTPSEEVLLHSYRRICSSTGLPLDGEDSVPAHNLLMGPDWMMVVPRTVAEYKDISANGLNFIGSLFVKTEAALEVVREEGPMRLMVRFGKPRTLPTRL
eukprot:TRINITY_DN6032_c0_g1_i1.p1 TRINITY_DN6032_c0_g1~~TRINITY_DN6032_c0_g1_i1.p1  ORF type:complete len:168 (-),score=30.11 TRINITY_DN6032_c0_g1_i1:9-512(-)